MANNTILPGQPVKSLDAISIVAATAGTSYGLNFDANQITWQTSFGVAPTAISVLIQCSNDGTNWNTADTSTAVGTGEIRTFCTSANFIRAYISTTTLGPGTTVTVTIIAKAGSGGGSSTGGGSGTSDATAANQTLQITQETAINTVLGATGDAAATAGSTGTVSAKLRVISDTIGAVAGAKVITDANGTIQQYLRGLVTLFITSGSALVTAICGGNVANDGVDSGNPIKIGGKANSLRANPTSVADVDRVDALYSRIGQLFVLNGHPNIVTLRYTTTGAGTDVSLAGTIASGTTVVVMSCAITTSGATTVQPSAIVGFGAANTPTTTGVIASHGGIVAGGGIVMSGMAIGGDGEEVRLTNAAPTTGTLEVLLRYFTITN